jgi:Fe-S cluster assembly protein SufB
VRWLEVCVTDTPHVGIDLSRYELGRSDEAKLAFVSQRGLSEALVRQVSSMKNEPEWMLELRLKSYEIFKRMDMPNWGADIANTAFGEIDFSLTPAQLHGDAGDESEGVHRKNSEALTAQGVIFTDIDAAVREHPELVRQYLGTIVPPAGNKFAALNSAAWSGGSFIYVPPGVEVEVPLQAHFRINVEDRGQFERTLIIAGEGSTVQFIEGCSAPVYSSDSLHAAVVELVALPGSCITYTTIQNWSSNVSNFVTKRAVAYAEAQVEWIDGNIGSRLTMQYPAVYLLGPKASGAALSVAYAGAGQHQDTGARMLHLAPDTTSKIVSKSISKDGGRSTYRDAVLVEDGMSGCTSHVQCDALLLDEISRADALPDEEVGASDSQIRHHGSVSRIADEQLFYLMSRGLSEDQAIGLIVNGFIEPVVGTLPMEYAVEWSRLIELQMEGSVG